MDILNIIISSIRVMHYLLICVFKYFSNENNAPQKESCKYFVQFNSTCCRPSCDYHQNSLNSFKKKEKVFSHDVADGYTTIKLWV